jgi:hypothetical protein
VVQAQDQTIPGAITTPYPTIINLAVEWTIQGDDNQNGIVTLQFREKGQTSWKQGMSLFRVPAGEKIGFKWINKHSGSIFDLIPNTEYEIKLTLTDPDGGSAERTVFAHTRPVPEIGINTEIIEIQSGRYDTLHTKSGSQDRPVVYRCTDGKGTFAHIDLNDRQWVFIQGLIIENSNKEGIGIRMNGAKNCAVIACTLNSPYGIVADKPGATNCYISDNVLTGTCVWTSEAMGSNGDNIGEGIQITGPGNVICYNRVTGFRDCISTMEDQRTYNQICIDIYNNDVFRGVDDAIEADFCFSNCRIFRNRITNCYMGLSSQPGLGGPNYFVRNVMYNIINGGLKLQRYSQGDVILHNTMIKIGRGLGGNTAMDYEYFRNNLAIGGPIPNQEWGKYGVGKPYAADIQKPGKHSTFDYDAVGVYGTPYQAKIGDKSFSEVEKHGIEKITMEETFNHVEFPNPPAPERGIPILRPNASSRVIDGGVIIPNINDDFKGTAPDCGAYEYGQELPHYGPRDAIKNATIPGELSSPYPTLINLGIEWLIRGDDNQNGVVTVQFREKGRTEWKQGMPLFRVPSGEKLSFSWKNKFAGSIFDLKPDTPYEIMLNLSDPDGGDTERTIEARTRPEPGISPDAEIIEIKPGLYDTLKTKSGSETKPVVYQCSKGKATFAHIDMLGKQWVYINGFEIVNQADSGIAIRMDGASDCMVSRCKIQSTWGIVAYYPGAENCYICDNEVTGINKWNNESMGAHGANVGEGIEMTGPGNVICYNKVTGFRDCISTMEDQHVMNQTSIDIYNNEINLGLDDGIEADFCFSNCRIYRNRLTNCFVGLSSQPGLGGPNYFMRNSMYNIIYGGFKLRRYSEGDVVLHNSVVKVGSGIGGNDSMDFAWFRNNLAIGGPAGGVNWGDYGSGKPSGADISRPKIHCSFDYDAVGVFGVPYVAMIGNQSFSAVEKHGVENITLEDTFPDVQFPDPPVPERGMQDLRPRQGARIIDAALRIPNINDEYEGTAPDCGAYEYGQELPHYGPRR